MKDNNSIEDNVNQALDDSVADLSPEIRRQLNQARIKATQDKPAFNRYWKVTGAVSFVLMIGLSYRFTQEFDNAQYLQDDLVTPIAELSSQLSGDMSAELLAEDFDMIDDLEFAYWLAEENDLGIL